MLYCMQCLPKAGNITLLLCAELGEMVRLIIINFVFNTFYMASNITLFLCAELGEVVK